MDSTDTMQAMKTASEYSIMYGNGLQSNIYLTNKELVKYLKPLIKFYIMGVLHPWKNPYRNHILSKGMSE